MKSISLLLSLFLATNVFAQEIVKSCKTKLSFPGTEEIYNTNLTVIKKGNSLAVKTWQQSDRGGPIKEFEEVATVAEFQIRRELIAQASKLPEDYQLIAKLNPGEYYIAHAVMLESDPIFAGEFRSGIELTEIAKIKAYQLGKATHMGQAAIVEAYDQNGDEMGSFFGGFIVTPCL